MSLPFAVACAVANSGSLPEIDGWMLSVLWMPCSCQSASRLVMSGIRAGSTDQPFHLLSPWFVVLPVL